MAKDIEVQVEHGEYSAKDYHDPPPAPLIDPEELFKWSFYRALIAEFIATLLFLYITVLTVIGYKSQSANDQCGGVGILGIAWAFGGMIFILVYCTAGISGGHINPAVTFGLFLARKVSLIRAFWYMVAQCLGAICGCGLVKAFQKAYYNKYGVDLYSKSMKVLAPLPIGFAVFMVHLATIPITGTGINPARSLGAAVIFNKKKAWDDQWIFWVGPFVGAAIAALYHQFILRAAAIKALGSFRSNA
ncbi:hypothetical protein SLEP1_g13783 [Rubroshorea leprosula]|uniref:Uncharacterized protein n=1 Tax=Rubroshorea leprosula TaxID=152421 RepID=A0AAV5ISG9_9ROSI|nr:hypothetical protein SLEP1_g13783 [Rubroshorea leprosula]